MRLLLVCDPGASSRGGNCWNVLQREHGHGHMSDTPRTDAIGEKFFTPHHCLYEDLARQIEMELNEFRQQVFGPAPWMNDFPNAASAGAESGGSPPGSTVGQSTRLKAETPAGAARNAIIEECAKVCDDYDGDAKNCARMIRRLKTENAAPQGSPVVPDETETPAVAAPELNTGRGGRIWRA